MVIMPPDIPRKLFGKRMKNPLILASGVLGVAKAGLEEAAENGAGAVTTKSLSLEPRKGHESPIIAETECGLLNAVGYSNPGMDDGIAEFSGWKREEPLIISIVGKDEREFARLANMLEQNKKTLNCAAVELALSCPHTPGFGLMAGQAEPAAAGRIAKAVRAETELPVIVKLSPSVPGEVEAAKLAEKAGASAINMGNSLGPGMKIDINRGRPVLGFRMGGLSGPAIKPITVRCVYDIYDAVDIPVIGTGGVNTGQDAIEMMMAGAGLVGVGSAVYFRGADAFKKIDGEMRAWLRERGHKSAGEIVGVAHE
jgi:dihydroorotate dehydrogenase (NAD+) catalytic subunit